MNIRAARVKWETFWYNFGWSDWVTYVDGWIPRFSLFIPIVGYLIVFNDAIGKILVFKYLAGEIEAAFGLTGQQRLRFIYFGLLALGISNFVYRLKQPYVFNFGKNLSDYVTTTWDIFTFRDFADLHKQIRREGHLTLDGKYYDSEWDGFVAAATNPGEGTDRVQRKASWNDARSRYGSLLRSILRESFFRGNTGHRGWLVLCVTLSTVGYILLGVPSVDLLLKVVRSTFGW